MKLHQLILAIGLLALPACGTQVAGLPVPPAPQNAEQSLYETKTALDAAIVQATVYAKLPRCTTAVATPVCSNQAMAQKLYGLAEQANAAVDTGRAAVAIVKATATPTATDQQKAQAAATAAAAALQQVLGALTLLDKKA